MADDEDDKTSKDDDKNKPKKWRETCIGIYTKGGKAGKNKTEWICNGISVVRIDKDAAKSSVKPSQTRGLQIIMQELNDKTSSEKEQDDINRDPQRHVFPPEDPDLGKRVFNILRKKTETVEEKVDHYIHNGVNAKDVWQGVSDLTISAYQTTTRIISYCKPKEKLYQVYNFTSARIKNITNQWKKDSNDKGSKK